MHRQAKLQFARLIPFLCCVSCKGPEAPLPPNLLDEPKPSASVAQPSTPAGPLLSQPLSWQKYSRSPQPEDAPDPRTAQLLAACGQGDAALHQVAAHVANLQLLGQREPDMAQVQFAMRSQGSPYVWPRIWTIEGAALEASDLLERIERWVSSATRDGQARCGIAQITSSDKQVLALVAVDALAELAQVATQHPVGSNLNLRGKPLVQVASAQWVLLPPTGVPTYLETRLQQGEFRAELALVKTGRWLAQLLANTQNGPRPLLEVEFFVGETPRAHADTSRAPGETESSGSPSEILTEWLNGARHNHGLAALRPDKRLEALALRHSQAMATKERLAHDVGQGNPHQRVEQAGLSARITGENVARARSLERAHRALWSSPSHRGNWLKPDFTHVGIGVFEAPDGTLWVTQLFARY